MSTKTVFLISIFDEGCGLQAPPLGCAPIIFIFSSWPDWLCLTIDWKAVPMLHVLPVKHTQLYIRQDSSFDVVNGLTAGQLKNSGLFPGSDKRFPLLQNVQTGCGAHTASCKMYIRDPFPGIAWLRYAANNLGPSREKVKNAYSWNPRLPHVITVFSWTPFFAIYSIT